MPKNDASMKQLMAARAVVNQSPTSPTPGEVKRLREENERLKFYEQCAEERASKRGFLNIASPTALYEAALTATEEKLLATQSALAAAERERDVYKAIIEAATLESVDTVSAQLMREKFCERNDKLTAAEQRLAEVQSLLGYSATVHYDRARAAYREAHNGEEGNLGQIFVWLESHSRELRQRLAEVTKERDKLHIALSKIGSGCGNPGFVARAALAKDQPPPKT